MSSKNQDLSSAAAQTLDSAAVLDDYRLAVISREASLLGRKEVFMGKAKFGIFGDGKEVAQLAMARAFRPGDWRAGYYRDQTFMFAIGALTVREYFAQLYAHTDVAQEPSSGGRLMNGHFSTRFIDEHGQWRPQTELKNSSSDISPTGGQMPRLLGLAYASKLYRHLPDLADRTHFSHQGNEVAFGTIGNASTSEGLFFEAINAAAVLQVPIVMSVWDDGYGISVPQEYHTAKGSISEALAGMQRTPERPNGLEIMTVKGWDYPALIDTYERAAELARTEHVPVLIHVEELTQPQGHSTSGSHERYKSPERLAWELEWDAIRQMRHWILQEGIADEATLESIEKEARQVVSDERRQAWQAYRQGIDQELTALVETFSQDPTKSDETAKALAQELGQLLNPGRAEVARLVRRYLISNPNKTAPDGPLGALKHWWDSYRARYRELFNDNLIDDRGVEAVVPVAADYGDDAPQVDGREVLNAYFEGAFRRYPELFTLGEDVGRIGDVNQGMAGMQAKFGEWRVTDTGIREATILGQGIGAALRGLRPLVEIQYLDYLLYALQGMSDDLATTTYRTAGGQRAPVIVRTRGHRLEGVWHSGSPMGMILGSVRGMHVVVPRDMTQAAGFYNTLLAGQTPALVIEPLNGYRLKERMPTNLNKLALPLGVPEVLREGKDVTVITYGSMCRIVMDAATYLSERLNIELEVIDARTLLPFDTEGVVVQSLKKTSRLICADEDVPGGASAYLLQQILEVHQGYRWLDSAPLTIAAQPHRPAYGTDGDYFSKPNAEDLIEAVYSIMAEADPGRFS